MASGRFGPLALQEWDVCIPKRFIRREIGFCIVGPYKHPFFADLKAAGQSIDPKLILQGNNGTQWRTFCFCDRGEVVGASFSGGLVLSGPNDCQPTQQTNLGFNLRVSDEVLGKVPVWGGKPFMLPLQAVLTNASTVVSHGRPRLNPSRLRQSSRS